jgi:hypothetical protein
MKVIFRVLSALLAVPLVVAPAFAAKVEHSRLVEPKFTQELPAELKAIGQPTRLMVRGTTLYVAATGGVAAIGADGKALWVTPLDPIGIREIAVDDAGVAYSGYEIKGESTTVWKYFGNFLKDLDFTPSVVGMLKPDGTKVWQAAGPAKRISAPGLGPQSIGILSGQEFHLFARADGAHKVVDGDFEPAILPNQFATRLFRPRPVFVDGNFAGGHFDSYYRISPEGQLLEKDRQGKTVLVAGPVLFKGSMLVGSYSWQSDMSVNKGLVALVEPSGEFDRVWREDISDDHSSTGDIVVDGDTVYASSNFTVAALNATGKKIWEAGGKNEGALIVGSMRGVRFIKNMPYRWWGGNLLQVAGDRLYLSSEREIKKKTWADVITVLNKKDGSYVETIDLKEQLVDMAVWQGRLVLATAQGVRIIALN